MIDLTQEQKTIINTLWKWIGSSSDSQFITLGGFAGTGKTTLISILRKEIHNKNSKAKIAFCAFTGKAARVLQEKLTIQKAIFAKDFVGTIHSLIYSPITNIKEEIVGWEKKESIPFDLIIVDEASMVDQIIWEDLLSFRKKIVAVGDHGQLPPIKGSFSLMKDPNLKLERIHRQAQDNPIIKLSIAAREQGRIEPGEYSHTVKKFIKSEYDSQEEIEEKLRGFNNDTLVLCGYNKTRIDLNGFIRNALEIESSEPISTDRVICLKNNHKKQIFNGMLGTIRSINRENDKWYLANIEMDGAIGKFKGLIAIDQFNSSETLNFTSHRKKYIEGDLFDFGYAITVHKAQGSQSKKVILFEERFSKMDDDMWRRWLYTAVTRAEEELYIVGE